MPIHISQGSPIPLGATPQENGVNFSLFVEHTDPVLLQLHDIHTLEVIDTMEVSYRTGQIRHLFLGQVALPLAYSYRILSEEFKSFELVDPYAKALATPINWGRNHAKYRPVALALPAQPFDWENDSPPHLPKEDLLIYEMHVRGYTQDSSAHAKHPGTFLGVIEKIDHLLELGVNAVELMPVHEFNENEYPPAPLLPSPLCQYWGYSSVNFFALMNRYASSSTPGAVINEFKQMVKALHKAGIEVILDVVFNHSAEGNIKGPIYSYKALGKEVYYLMDKKGDFANYTGCGNTINCNHPVVIQMILDSLRYYVTEFHVDGFRFDLASIFYRGPDDSLLQKPAVLSAISRDPLLSSVKLIVEPWDAAGLFQVGGFYTDSTRFTEWNSYYRDDVRRFIKGDKGIKGKFATRLAGSEDLYGHEQRLPRNSLNFNTCHDGFTLQDLVSYNRKHNEENGEQNADGSNHNDSWNCGVEGASEDPNILNLRERQMKNFHLALMVSQGVPMLLMGDEYRHTRLGNNNSWCQDNPLNWFQWDNKNNNAHFFRFYRMLIQFRNSHPLLHHRKYLKDSDVAWHGKKPFQPLWDHEEHFLAFTLIDHDHGRDLYVAFNAGDQETEIELPELSGERFWHWIANTALHSPDDYKEKPLQITPKRFKYKMAPFSALLLEASHQS
mgnify:CR=1 FL=1